MGIIPKVYVIGDSHTNVFNHSLLFLVYHIGPATAFNLINIRSSTDSYEKIKKILLTVKKGDVVILVFGEIDCRIHIFYQFKKHQEKMSLSELIDKTVHNYGEYIKMLKKQGIELCICGITPVGEEKNIYNYPYYAERHVQSSIYNEFNSKLKSYCEYSGVQFLNIYPLTSDASGFLQKAYSDDGLHLNAKILPNIEDMLYARYGMRLRIRNLINKIREEL
jgi:lysophospholipase L1-like esterase